MGVRFPSGEVAVREAAAIMGMQIPVARRE
jgi:hypothetical protein